MNELFQGFKYIRVYLGDILVLTNSDYNDHLTELEKVLIKWQEKEENFNMKNSLFAQLDMEYLGFRVTREGVKPTAEKRSHIIYGLSKE